MRKRFKGFWGALLISLGSAFLISFLFWAGFLGGWQNRLNDLLILPRPASPEIVIAAIDDKSLSQIGRWPWSRAVQARLVDALRQAEARLIVFDVNFSEPENQAADRSLAQAIKKAGNVILPVEAEKLIYHKGQWLATRLIEPLPELKTAALALAHVNITPDSDNVARRLPASWVFEEKEFAALGVLLGQNLGGRSLTTDEKNRVLINFTGRPGNFRYLSISDILAGKTEDLAGKVVLIGATAADLHDAHLTPTSRGLPMPGVEIHANLAQTVLEGRFLKKPSKESTVSILFLLALVVGLLVWDLKPLWAGLATFALLVLYFLGNLLIYETGLIGDTLYGLAAIILTFLTAVLWRSLTETKERERVTKIFGRYVAPKVVDKILAASSEDLVQLGGTKETVTVLFADIRGFTPTSEKMQPEEVVMMLNAYLSAFSEAIFEEEGTLDKFVGDEVMALFNTPLPQNDHAERAIRTALSARGKIEELHQRRPDLPRVSFGVGIHTGEAVIGNIGSHKRADFTAIGDTINLGARLMGVAKENQIIVSQATYGLVQNKFEFKKLEPVLVKGKEKPVEIWEVVGARKDVASVQNWQGRQDSNLN